MTEWKYPAAVVETDWLAEHLDDEEIRIYDCTTYLRYMDDDPSLPYVVESGRAPDPPPASVASTQPATGAGKGS